jgi:hypothetical protein
MTVKSELIDELNRAELNQAFEDYCKHFGEEDFCQLSIPGPLAIDAIKLLREAIATDTPLPR